MVMVAIGLPMVPATCSYSAEAPSPRSGCRSEFPVACRLFAGVFDRFDGVGERDVPRLIDALNVPRANRNAAAARLLGHPLDFGFRGGDMHHFGASLRRA